jgi:superfamily II DNA or RNA helicase
MNGVLRPLRPHQERALEGLRRYYSADRRRLMVQLPTGAGKTRLAAESSRTALCSITPATVCVSAW